MKLLPSFAERDKQQEETARKLMRAQEVEKLLESVNKQLASAQANFSEALARQQRVWAQEEEAHAVAMKEREAEVSVLEERKRQALVPIEIYKAQADEKMREADERMADAMERELNVGDLQERLEEKLTEVSDREQQLSSREKAFEVAKSGLDLQRSQLESSIQDFQNKLNKFQQNKALEEASLEQRKREVALAEISLNAKIEKYRESLEALRVWEIQLMDERATLDREYERRKKEQSSSEKRP